ncbi:hypothetical protein D3C86_2106580 [compost metagenome]
MKDVRVNFQLDIDFRVEVWPVFLDFFPNLRILTIDRLSEAGAVGLVGGLKCVEQLLVRIRDLILQGRI